ncbi:MAG: hypothetical protein H7A47_14550 [Verrucomicrobiales bacterium]|nr:hypothetical protein [Verrucomicrobiales bacterium]
MFWPETVQDWLSQQGGTGRRARGRVAAAGLAVLLVAGCSREGTRTYEVPKEAGQPAAPAMASMQVPPPQTSGNGVTWTLPAGWEELEPNQFRVGNFRVSGEGGQSAEISIIPLPGLAGTDLDNVNRWRGQVGLGPISEAEFPEQAEKVSIGDGEGSLFDLKGAARDGGDAVRMLAAIHRREGTAWFVKMLGPDTLVGAQKPALVALMKSLSFGSATASAPAPTPPTVAAGGSAAKPAPPSGAAEGTPKWTVPTGWTETSPGMMQLARFTVSGEGDAAAEVSVAVLGGDGGGMLPNVNRWRRQLGLGPISETELQSATKPLEGAGAGASIVVIDQAADGRKMLAAVVPAGAQTWFYKLVGDGAVVTGQTAAFTAFVKSAGHGR